MSLENKNSVKKEGKQAITAIMVLAILISVLLFLAPKLFPKKYNNNQQKIESLKKQSMNRQLGYFGPYMYNLQKKLGLNREPSKGKPILVKFRIARDGSLLKTQLIKSSGNAAADAKAIKTLKKSAPFEPLPKEFKEKFVDVQFNFY